MTDHSYKLPGKTLAESLGIDTTGAPGGQRILRPAPGPWGTCKRVTHGPDHDANWHPEPNQEVQ